MRWERPLPARKLKVLVIDDDNSVADTLAMILNFSGYDAIAAYNGEHGLDLARQAPIDHVVTDVVMEPVNGIQAAIAIQAICPGCTVLLISGNDRTSKLLADAVRDGYNFDILPKPVHPTVILDFLRGTTEPASNRSRNHPTV
jgi:DNA-binding NtrC family response regulator